MPALGPCFACSIFFKCFEDLFERERAGVGVGAGEKQTPH